MMRRISASAGAWVALLSFAATACLERSTAPSASMNFEGVAACPRAADGTHLPIRFDESDDEVLPGVTLIWGSSYVCLEADAEGTYRFTVDVRADANNVEAVTIDGFILSHTTPRPRRGLLFGQGPAATGDTDDLPLTLEAGESAEFEVTGEFELVETDEGEKANLHFRASGFGNTTGDPFHLGINAHFRAPGATE